MIVVVVWQSTWRSSATLSSIASASRNQEKRIVVTSQTIQRNYLACVVRTTETESRIGGETPTLLVVKKMDDMTLLEAPREMSAEHA